MKKRIKFRMHAYSDAAGKSNPSAVRGGNEDNFYVDDNLCDEFVSRCESDVEKELCDYGLIMAVADGMGGMNAGEVASEIAVKTVQDFFSPGKINSDNSRDHQSRKKYLERLIVEADSRIKQDAHDNPEHAGMGSTIILAWIVGNEMTLSWCGDSRAYRFNAQRGIELISEDHSYVQDLVKQGKLTYEQTFEHPQGNIVTRSLGDESQTAKPETRFFNVYDGDIILLCSDGLSGVLRDRKTPDGQGGYYPGDNLEDVIKNNRESLVACRLALWQAAEAADWYDNVTAILCEIIDGAGAVPVLHGCNVSKGGVAKTVCDEKYSDKYYEESKPFWAKTVMRVTPKGLVLSILIAIVLLVGSFFAYGFIKNLFDKKGDNTEVNYIKGGGGSSEQESLVQKAEDISPDNGNSSFESSTKGNIESTPETAGQSSKNASSGEESSDPLEQSVELTPQNSGEVEITPENGDTLEQFVIIDWQVKYGDTFFSKDSICRLSIRNIEKIVVKFNLISEDYAKSIPTNNIIADSLYHLIGVVRSVKYEDLTKKILQDGVSIRIKGSNDAVEVGNDIATFFKGLEREKVYVIVKN